MIMKSKRTFTIRLGNYAMDRKSSYQNILLFQEMMESKLMLTNKKRKLDKRILGQVKSKTQQKNHLLEINLSIYQQIKFL